MVQKPEVIQQALAEDTFSGDIKSVLHVIPQPVPKEPRRSQQPPLATVAASPLIHFRAQPKPQTGGNLPPSWLQPRSVRPTVDDVQHVSEPEIELRVAGKEDIDQTEDRHCGGEIKSTPHAVPKHIPLDPAPNIPDNAESG